MSGGHPQHASRYTFFQVAVASLRIIPNKILKRVSRKRNIRFQMCPRPVSVLRAVVFRLVVVSDPYEEGWVFAEDNKERVSAVGLGTYRRGNVRRKRGRDQRFMGFTEIE